MKYTVIISKDKVQLKEFNRMLSPVGLTVHPTILEEYAILYEINDKKLKIYDVHPDRIEYFIQLGKTEVIEGVDFNLEEVLTPKPNKIYEYSSSTGMDNLQR